MSLNPLRRALLGASALTLLAAAPAAGAETTTPIEHVVVIFQENVSFDHYFGTYPHAENKAGEPAFTAKEGTPYVNGLTEELLKNNPNKDNPHRLDRAQAITCDMYHGYTVEQKAYNAGLMNRFEEYTFGDWIETEKGWAEDKGCHPAQVMGYYDGNTVTALWNYAQHYAMSDNAYGSVYGPSTPGALNLVRGNTYGADPANVDGHIYEGLLYGDLDPHYDDCSDPDPNHPSKADLKHPNVKLSGRNVGDQLNGKGITWGWFQGGFKPSSRSAEGLATCESKTKNAMGVDIRDYTPHHQPFQYFPQTSNPHHLPPTSVDMIGKQDQANHQYDLSDFFAAIENGNVPAVSFIKAKAAQDGHAGNSGPIDEQKHVVETINRLMDTPQWEKMAIIMTYDDSDGWYDHVMPPVLQRSDIKGVDALFGEEGLCGTPGEGEIKGRCGLGPRIPLLVISPYAKENYVDHVIVEQASVLRFIQDNWNLGRLGNQSFDARAGDMTGMFDWNKTTPAPKLKLDPETGLVASK